METRSIRDAVKRSARPLHHVFGDEAGEKIQDVKTAWENVVLKAHGTP